MKSSYPTLMLLMGLLGASTATAAQNHEDVVSPATQSRTSISALSGEQPGQLKVTCKGDQLTILANGSPLSSILSEVAKCSGAKIENSGVSPRMEFFETIGPAPIRTVLAELLDASGVNYVVQVSDSNPARIATVMLFGKDHGAASDSADDRSGSAGRRAFLEQLRQNSRQVEEPEPPAESASGVNAAAVDTPPSGDPEPAPLEPPPANASRIPSPPIDSTPVSSQTNLQDRIADMQRMFEQRKQMVQEQNSRQH